MSAPAPAAPISVRVFAPSAHLLAPTRSAAEGALAVRQALASALAGAAETHGQEPAPPSYTRNTASTGSQKDAVVLRVPAEEVIAREAAELRLLAPSTTTTRPELDATAKLFLPSPASSTSSSSAASSSGADGSSAVEAALVELAKLLGQGVDHVDTLILAWGGVAYEGEELGFFTNKRPEQLIGASGAAGADNLSDEALNAMVALWQVSPMPVRAMRLDSPGLTSAAPLDRLPGTAIVARTRPSFVRSDLVLAAAARSFPRPPRPERPATGRQPAQPPRLLPHPAGLLGLCPPGGRSARQQLGSIRCVVSAL